MIKHLLSLRAPAGTERAAWARSLAAAVDARFRWYEVDLAAETDELLARGRRPGRPQAFDALVSVWSADETLDTAWTAGIAEIVECRAVSETVHWDDGVAATVKQVAFAAPRPDLALDDFAARYREHAGVAREHHPGVRRYVQNFVMTRTGSAAAVAELAFENEEAYRERFYRDAASPAAVAADVERFLDRAATSSVIVVTVAARRRS